MQEINSVFSRCGVISEEIDRGKPRIKIYTDEDGNPKGDALVVYFRAESVDLAVQMLDDTDFRFGILDAAGKIKVQPADFSYKQNTGQEHPRDKKSNLKEKRKVIAKTQKLNKYIPLRILPEARNVLSADCVAVVNWLTGMMMIHLLFLPPTPSSRKQLS